MINDKDTLGFDEKDKKDELFASVKDGEIKTFINELFPHGYRVLYFYRTKGKAYASDGIMDYSISPKINIVIQDKEDKKIYNILLSKEAFGFIGFYWWLYTKTVNGRESKIRLRDTINPEEMKEFITKVNKSEMVISLYDGVEIVDIYDALNDKSVQSIHIKVDNMDEIEIDNEGIVESLPNGLFDKCIKLIKMVGFKHEMSYFILVTDDKKELIFEAVKLYND